MTFLILMLATIGLALLSVIGSSQQGESKPRKRKKVRVMDSDTPIDVTDYEHWVVDAWSPSIVKNI